MQILITKPNAIPRLAGALFLSSGVLKTNASVPRTDRSPGVLFAERVSWTVLGCSPNCLRLRFLSRDEGASESHGVSEHLAGLWPRPRTGRRLSAPGLARSGCAVALAASVSPVLSARSEPGFVSLALPRRQAHATSLAPTDMASRTARMEQQSPSRGQSRSRPVGPAATRAA